MATTAKNGKERHEAVIRQYGRMLIKNPRSYIFVSMAESCIRAGRAKMALELLNKGLRWHPTLTAAHVQKGRALMALGRFMEARQSLAYAVNSDPSNVLARKLLAQLHLENGAPAKGMALLDEVRRLWPDHEPPAKLYGQLKRAMENETKDEDYREERESPGDSHREAMDTLGQWLDNANRMMGKG